MKKPSANFMMLKLIEQNKDVIQNPIIKSFLDKKENYKLVSNAISYPSEKNKNKELNYIPFCSKHWNCCYHEGCPATFGYIPSTGKEIFIKCGC